MKRLLIAGTRIALTRIALTMIALTMIALTMIALTACSPSGDYAAPQAELATAEYKLPVSINDVMVALVNESADPIWVAAWSEPETDADWRQLERRAFQLRLAGSLIAQPGTGPMDDKWTAEPAWAQWSYQLKETGLDAIVAVENRDLVAISHIGDQLIEVCEGCHREFKLPLPTGGKYGELSPTPSDPNE